MSKTKNLGLIFLLLLFSFCLASCKNSTPVEDIYFNLNQGEQIVLIAGQTFNLGDYVEIKPNYATNKKYHVRSYNEEVVAVQGNKLVALKEGSALIKVVSDDNELKESTMTIVVKSTKEKLSTPLNLIYNGLTQNFTFDKVVYATSYTFKINGQEINIGNTNSFNLNDFQGVKFDKLMVVQVRANSPSYSYALEDSNFTNEYKIYQAGAPSKLSMVGGVLSFEKSGGENKYNVYIDNKPIANKTSESIISVNTLDEMFAGVVADLEVEAVVSNETKQQYGSDVSYFNSTRQSLGVSVFDVPNLTLNSSTISWQNIANASGYDVYIDGEKKAQTKNNYFDLQSLNNYETLITTTKAHKVKISPVLADTTVNVAKTSKESTLDVQRLEKPIVECDGVNLKWNEIENASVYSIKLVGTGVDLNSSIAATSLSMATYAAGSYSLKIRAVAKENVAGGVHFVSSLEKVFEFSKHAPISAVIENYDLKIANLNNDKCLVDFSDNSITDKTINGATEPHNLGLETYDFAPGPHKIVLTRMGNSTTINSDPFEKEFVQFEAVSTIDIANHVATVERSDNNENATIELITTGNGKTIGVEDISYAYNTTNMLNEDSYLPAGEYTTKVYVRGNGSTTFSYREVGSKIDKASAEVTFNVLEMPTLSLLDTSEAKLSISSVVGAESYNVHEDTEIKSIVKTETQYLFDLNNGSKTFKIQAIGNGETTFDSAISTELTITRLKTPSLEFNNITKVISKQEAEDSVWVGEYVFTRNGSVEPYNFQTALNVADGDIFTLTAIAETGTNHLNSLPFALTLTQISNDATISLNNANQLEIQPTSHTKRHDLKVLFKIQGGAEKDFSQNGNLLTDGTYELPLTYLDGAYYVTLVNSDHNAIFEELNDGFVVQAIFIEPLTGDKTLINSERTNESEELNLINISSETEITVNTNNQLVLTPVAHIQEYALNVVINNGADLSFVSNGADKLVCGSIELPYAYDSGVYYINLLSNTFDAIIENLGNTFTAKVQYRYHHDAISDLDSVFSGVTNINVQSSTTITRDGQNLKILNIKPTYTYENYALVVNDCPTAILLNDSNASQDGNYIVFNVEHVYSKTPAQYLHDVNDVSVLVLNLETETSPLLSKKGEALKISKTDTVELTWTKDNNEANNSVIISCNRYVTSYGKRYYVEIYNDGEANKQTIVYEDTSTEPISLNLDEVENIEGMIYIRAYVITNGVDNSVQMFNSIYSNELSFERVDAITMFTIADSTIEFDAVNNAVGYEIWEKNGETYSKISSALITGTSYRFASFAGQKEIVFKAISKINGYTNSSYSDIIKISKVKQPTISVQNGKLRATFDFSMLALLTNPNISITPVIENAAFGEVEIDLNNIDGNDLKLSLNTLIAEPYLFLNYGTDSIILEKLSFEIKVNNTSAVDGVYYLNSDPVEITCHGLFAPTAVNKTTDDNNTVEMISWTASDKNIINGSVVPAKYVFKIEHTVSGQTKTYYSYESDLKYYDTNTETYMSYGSAIAGTSAVFPAGYGIDDDGKLITKFEAGLYKVAVQTIPDGSIDGYNLCSSKYTDYCEFEILQTPTMSVSDGMLSWSGLDKADKYKLSITKKGETTPTVVEVTTNAYDFSHTNLSGEGVYAVTIKAISTGNDALNSAESDPYYVYRLPQAAEVSIDDGKLILTSSQMFHTAKIELVDTNPGGNVYELPGYDNSARANAILGKDVLNVTNWETFDPETNIAFDAIYKFQISLDDDVLKSLSGSNYTINVKLIGNTSERVGIISSVKATNVSGLTATKLNPSETKIVELEPGVVQYLPDSSYATISEGDYAQATDLNYAFNGQTSSSFWHNTILYKIVIVTPSGPVEIYAVDYYSFIKEKAKASPSIEYMEFTNLNTLCATVKYDCEDVLGNATTLHFNVYENNHINLRDYDNIYYYKMSQSFYAEDITVSGNFFTLEENDVQYIDLSVGGSFSVMVHMLGGDSNLGIGHISSTANYIYPFERYGAIVPSAVQGKVQFDDLTPMGALGALDNPVYKLVATEIVDPGSGATPEKITFYIYSDITEDDAKTVAQRLDSSYLNATYLQIGNDEKTVELKEGKIIFDLSKYLSKSNYKLSVRTLVGLGAEDEVMGDYLINAKEPDTEYTFRKLSSTEFAIQSGVLTFEQSYSYTTLKRSYCEDYEITLYDGSDEYIFTINAASEGVKIKNNVVTYELPKELRVKTAGTLTDLSLDENKTYIVKIRALANGSVDGVLNGTYLKDDENDKVLEFTKALGVNNVKIENGVLKWTAKGDCEQIKVKVSFKDKFNQQQIISFTHNASMVVGGTYSYSFIDGAYTSETAGGSYVQIVDKFEGKEEFVDYEIEICTVGNSGNILNSNYSEKFTTNRLSPVDKNSIKTIDGILKWQAVADADYYNVSINGVENKNLSLHTTSLNVSTLNLPVGNYTVAIRAIGNDKITSIATTANGTFIQLGVVDEDSIAIGTNDSAPTLTNVVRWDAVDNAQGYVFKLIVGGNEKVNEPVDNPYCEISADILSDIDGEYEISITAISKGEGNIFNGQTITVVRSNSAPDPVSSANVNNADKTLTITIESGKYTGADKIRIGYNFAAYTDSGKAVAIAQNEFIDLSQFKEVAGGVLSYTHKFTSMGEYTSISVQVIRTISETETLSSNSVATDNINLNFFKYGAGVEQNPYRIENATQLLNIGYYPSAHYQLAAGIDMSEVNIEERLVANDGVLICDTFSGTLDGLNTYAIFGFNRDAEHKIDTINLGNAGKFALFNTIDNATIKNLTIGQQDYSINIVNTFAETVENMVNLSLIATGANNSTIDDVYVIGLNVKLGGAEQVALEQDINVAGLVNKLNNSTISNSRVEISIEINSIFKVESTIGVYLGGLATTSNNCVVNCDNDNYTNVTFTVYSTKDCTIQYIGGMVAYSEGTELSGVTANVDFGSVKSLYLGGLIGFAKSTDITSCHTEVKYDKTGINYELYLGGLVGAGRSVSVQNSSANVDFTISVFNTGYKYIGAIAGYLIEESSINNCNMNNYSNNDQTSVNTGDNGVVIGIYGYKTDKVIVSNCGNIQETNNEL